LCNAAKGKSMTKIKQFFKNLLNRIIEAQMRKAEEQVRYYRKMGANGWE
jgi:hypothetical protein